ncbi:MAG: 50S ribosomal protein L11 methyltransferase [Gammaproteobacteria bacterium]|jgi:ribosomal protein L11 methyltransferase
MPWLQAHLISDKDSAPVLETLLETLGALSVTLTDAGDEPQLETAPGEERIWSETIVTGLFAAATQRASLQQAIRDALGKLGIETKLTLEELEDQPWERAWMENFHAMQFGRRLWILPRGQQLPQDAADPVVVVLDPGLAFGTGTHPTTALCLEWLDGQELAGKSLIDFGCGSGILAIAALKLGAGSALGIDHDPQALIASEQNAQENGVAERLRLIGSNVPVGEQADILVANILASVLVELAPGIGVLVKPGGRLALSGILAEQAEAVIDAFSGMFDLDTQRQQEEWVLITGRRKA